MLEGFTRLRWKVVGYEWQLHISQKENSSKSVSIYMLVSLDLDND
jgi:hypothetical protein